MNIDYTTEELEFQQEIRTWFKENLPADIKRKNLNGEIFTKEETVSWQKTLNEAGFLVVGWPEEHGGPGWTATQRYIYDSERAAAGAPVGMSMGIIMLGPVLMAFGTQEQKDLYLPRIKNCDDWWCQGYSEPGAGSDLASLNTQAVLDGDEYVINGTKIWTTYGHYANRCFCLVRTDNDCKAQMGISFILIDMDSKGIDVRPIISIDGEHHLNQVFFDDVRVPKENLIGEEGQGWTIAKYLLTHERTTIAGVADSTLNFTNIKELARTQIANGAPLIEDEQLRLKLASEEIKLLALEYTNFRTLADTAAGRAPGPESSLLKVKGTETQQSLSELRMEMAGNYAYIWKAEDESVAPAEFLHASEQYNFLRACTIYGGSTEVQKNVVAKMLLGLK